MMIVSAQMERAETKARKNYRWWRDLAAGRIGNPGMDSSRWERWKEEFAAMGPSEDAYVERQVMKALSEALSAA